MPRAAAWAACAGLALLLPAAGPRPAAGEPTPTRPESRLPELVRTKNRSFTIPFQPPQSQDPDPDARPQRILLNVSRDMGLSWETAGEAAPTAGSFTFRAEADGEYWFRLRALDRKGRSRGGEGPDVRVLVDAAGPRLAARVWKGADGEIVCRYAAADDSLKLESLRVEYRGPEDRGWKTVAAQGIVVRESPAHVVGEEIWWAGEKVEALTVQIAIADASGNQAVKQFKMQPSDPGVDQAALAREIGLQPLPEGAAVAAADDRASSVGAIDRPAGDTPAVATTAAGGWSAEAGAAWSSEEPPRTSASGRPAGTAPTRPAPTSPPPRPAATPVSSRPAADPALAAATGGPEYLGKPLHLARSRRFQWDYEVPAGRAATTAARAELWTTRDGGVSWQKAAVDTDGRSPIEVELAGPGLYGVRLEVVVDAADRDGGPRSGEMPDAWVGIDEEPPQVELVAVTRDDAAADGATLLIRYAARDQLLAPRSTRLLYSPHPDGPWATIAEALENQGEHRWQPGRGVPARVHVRVESTDAAGNTGHATSAEAIATAAPRVGGKLGGLRVLPPGSAP